MAVFKDSALRFFAIFSLWPLRFILGQAERFTAKIALYSAKNTKTLAD